MFIEEKGEYLLNALNRSCLLVREYASFCYGGAKQTHDEVHV